MKTRFKTLKSYSDSHLSLLMKQVRQQLSVLEIVRSALPDELAPHAVHSLCEASKLILYTDSPAWAARLRFYEQAVLNTVNSATKLNLNKCQIKVLNHYSAKVIARKPHIPSPEVIGEIQQLSQSIEDEKLKQALAKLSATLSRAKVKNKP